MKELLAAGGNTEVETRLITPRFGAQEHTCLLTTGGIKWV